MTSFDVYLFTRLDAIHNFLIVPFLVGMIGGVSAVCYSQLEKKPEWFPRGKRLLVMGFLSLMLDGIIPNTKEAAAIYLLPKIANNEQVQQVPDKALTLLNGKLDEWIEDLRGKEKK